jgi:hypothetical protein
MRATPRPSSPPSSVADYLADREGLEGTSRAVFLELLYDAFGFRVGTSARAPMFFGTLAIGIAVCGIGIEWQHTLSLSAAWPWLGIATIGAIFAILIARDRRRASPLNHEQEWRAYCLVVRPIILRDRPGLLNRNLASDQSVENEIAIGYSSTVQAMFRERSSEFWIAAGAGWAIAATLILTWRIAAGWTEWLLTLPVAGVVVGPVAWGIFRLTVFRRLRRITDSER